MVQFSEKDVPKNSSETKESWVEQKGLQIELNMDDLLVNKSLFVIFLPTKLFQMLLEHFELMLFFLSLLHRFNPMFTSHPINRDQSVWLVP